MLTLSPSSVTRLSVPSKCERRTWLRYNSDVEPSPDGPFQVVLKKLGIAHERRVLAQLQEERGEFVDLDSYDNPNALAETIEAVEAGRNIYQGKFKCPFPDAPDEVMLQGLPDFLYLDDDGKTWVIADAKLASAVYPRDGAGQIARKKNGEPKKIDKGYIVFQLQLYGWLFEQLFDGASFRLLVFTKRGVEEIEYDGGESSLAELRQIIEIKERKEEPWELFGNSKCGACGYGPVHCTEIALGEKNSGLIPELDGGPSGLGTKLAAIGLNSYPAIHNQFDDDVEALRDSVPGSTGEGIARRVLENIQAWTTGRPIRRKNEHGALVAMDQAVTEHDRYVMFDLEGIPPDLDRDYTTIYLWGMQVFGADGYRGEFEYALAQGSGDGDQAAWFDFLSKAKQLMDDNPGIPFVHWASYERDRITNDYLGQYGDDEHHTAQRVLDSLLDLYPITKKMVVVPLIGYSLKLVEGLPEVEEVSGFSRSKNEIGRGDDSVAGYIEAVETDDEERREELIESLLAYNQQDLEATWAVQQWLRSLA